MVSPPTLCACLSALCSTMPSETRPWRNLFRLDGHYLLALDGTGIYSSAKVSSPYCMKKVKRNGKVEYYQQMLAAAIVSADQLAVLPLCRK